MGKEKIDTPENIVAPKKSTLASTFNKSKPQVSKKIIQESMNKVPKSKARAVTPAKESKKNTPEGPVKASVEKDNQKKPEEIKLTDIEEHLIVEKATTNEANHKVDSKVPGTDDITAMDVDSAVEKTPVATSEVAPVVDPIVTLSITDYVS